MERGMRTERLGERDRDRVRDRAKYRRQSLRTDKLSLHPHLPVPVPTNAIS